MKSSYFVAFGFAAAASLWVASGQFYPSEAAESAPEPPTEVADENPLQRVRVADVAAQPMSARIALQGVTRADRKVAVQARTNGAVAEVLVADGDVVAEGQVLARLDVDERQVALDQARAQMAQREIEFQAASKLGKQGFGSEVKVAEAKAHLDAARANVKRAELDLAHTEIRAPFGGVIEGKAMEIGSFVNVGQALAQVIDLDPIVVEAQISERDRAKIGVGSAAQVETLDDLRLEGIVTYVAASANPATRTFAVKIEVPNPERRLVEGVTARILTSSETMMAVKAPPSALTLDDQGRVGVKAVNGGDVVEFHQVEVLGQEKDGVWLRGLPETARLIVVGQEFVKPGQKVAPVSADEGA